MNGHSGRDGYDSPHSRKVGKGPLLFPNSPSLAGEGPGVRAVSFSLRCVAVGGSGAPPATKATLATKRYKTPPSTPTAAKPGEGGKRGRPGFTLLETLIALGILATATVLVAQLGALALAERTRADDRLLATEAAANVLEAARARPWADLTPEWAAAQRLSDDLTDRLPEAILTVRVGPEPDRPGVKRVSVELGWKQRDGTPAWPVTMVGLFADRSAGGGS